MPRETIADYGYKLLNDWRLGAGGHCYQAEKKGKKYQLKILSSATWPVSQAIPNRDERIKKCLNLLQERLKFNSRIKEKDGGAHILAYAEEIFLFTNPSGIGVAGVTEAVPYVKNAIAFNDITAYEEKLQICHSAAKALSILHLEDMMHLDIKPDNMLITRTGLNKIRVTLIDFDQCCYVGHFSDNTAGTPSYQAPELVDLTKNEDSSKLIGLQSQIGLYTDVFSLGSVFAFLLTGSRPKLRHQSDNRNWVVSWKENVLHEAYLKDLINAMLNPDQNKRPDVLKVLYTLENKKYTTGTEDFTFFPGHEKLYQINPNKKIRRLTPISDNGNQLYEVYENGRIRRYTLNLMTDYGIFLRKDQRVSLNSDPEYLLDLREVHEVNGNEIDYTRLKVLGYSRLFFSRGDYYAETKTGSREKISLYMLKWFRIIK